MSRTQYSHQCEYTLENIMSMEIYTNPTSYEYACCIDPSCRPTVVQNLIRTGVQKKRGQKRGAPDTNILFLTSKYLSMPNNVIVNVHPQDQAADLGDAHRSQGCVNTSNHRPFPIRQEGATAPFRTAQPICPSYVMGGCGGSV